MTPKLKEKIKRTLSNYEIDLTDTDLKKLIKELEPIFKTNILTNLPTIKELTHEFNDRNNTILKDMDYTDKVFSRGMDLGVFEASKLLIVKIKNL